MNWLTTKTRSDLRPASPPDMASDNKPNSDDAVAVVSVDAMGGDKGPNAVIDGLARAARTHPNLKFVVHGDEALLAKRIAKRNLKKKCEVRHCDGVVTMAMKPSSVLRHGKGTSMWSAIETVRQKEAKVAISCGNTGALMAISMVKLKRAPGVNRPAIACLWPSRNDSGFNVLLDVGADIRADENDLVGYAKMGAAYARNGIGLASPRIGLLNVGTESHKGRTEIRAAHELLPAAADENGFAYVGFVEGSDIPSSRVDVVVTDGFTGNVTLKSVEGTANLINHFLREAFSGNPLSQLGALFAKASLRRLSRRLDPRRVNGGVLLGLNGMVVKSHGGADAVAVAAAIGLAARLSTKNWGDEEVREPQHENRFVPAAAESGLASRNIA